MSQLRAHSFSLFVILVLCLAISQVARADAATIPWMTGFFPSGDAFTLGISSPDSFAFLALSPDLPDMTVTWQCDDRGVCEGQGGGAITSGSASGQLLSTLGTLQATFSGRVTGGSAMRTAQYCPDEICLTYWFDQYGIEFSGTWSNGWHTVGWSSGSIGSDSTPVGLFYLTTSTPEPGTFTLIGLGISAFATRLKRRVTVV